MWTRSGFSGLLRMTSVTLSHGTSTFIRIFLLLSSLQLSTASPYLKSTDLIRSEKERFRNIWPFQRNFAQSSVQQVQRRRREVNFLKQAILQVGDTSRFLLRNCSGCCLHHRTTDLFHLRLVVHRQEVDCFLYDNLSLEYCPHH